MMTDNVTAVVEVEPDDDDYLALAGEVESDPSVCAAKASLERFLRRCAADPPFTPTLANCNISVRAGPPADDVARQASADAAEAAGLLAALRRAQADALQAMGLRSDEARRVVALLRDEASALEDLHFAHAEYVAVYDVEAARAVLRSVEGGEAAFKDERSLRNRAELRKRAAALAASDGAASPGVLVLERTLSIISPRLDRLEAARADPVCPPYGDDAVEAARRVIEAQEAAAEAKGNAAGRALPRLASTSAHRLVPAVLERGALKRALLPAFSASTPEETFPRRGAARSGASTSQMTEEEILAQGDNPDRDWLCDFLAIGVGFCSRYSNSYGRFPRLHSIRFSHPDPAVVDRVHRWIGVLGDVYPDNGGDPENGGKVIIIAEDDEMAQFIGLFGSRAIEKAAQFDLARGTMRGGAARQRAAEERREAQRGARDG